jgi:hypothetical protein
MKSRIEVSAHVDGPRGYVGAAAHGGCCNRGLFDDRGEDSYRQFGCRCLFDDKIRVSEFRIPATYERASRSQLRCRIRVSFNRHARLMRRERKAISVRTRTMITIRLVARTSTYLKSTKTRIPASASGTKPTRTLRHHHRKRVG